MFKLGKNFIFRMALLQKPFLGQKSLIIFSYGMFEVLAKREAVGHWLVWSQYWSAFL